MRNLLLVITEAIDVGIQSKESVGIIKRSEEFALYLAQSVDVEFQVVPGRRIGDHVPARDVSAVFFDRFKRIYGVSVTFGHFIAAFVQDRKSPRLYSSHKCEYRMPSSA